jgi:hypothetical protein
MIFFKKITTKEWQPPFCVNVDEFRFTPRIQRVNELEAGTRAKIKFYERLTKLFDSQGVKLKIPTVEKEILDLAKLHKVWDILVLIEYRFFFLIRLLKMKADLIFVVHRKNGQMLHVK